MIKNLSVIIPTYKEPEYLDLCLKSLIDNQTVKNEIIVVVDGFYDLNKKVLDKHSSHIKTVIFNNNQGLSRATNMGVYNASNEYVMVINDDNVAGYNWDKKLIQYINSCWDKYDICLSPNQIEPNPSIFKQFIIKNFGQTAESFDYDAFIAFTKASRGSISSEGYTLPFVVKKEIYLSVGGWDETYPGPYVVDLEFFYKLQLQGIRMLRMYNNPFYHFSGKGTIDIDKRTSELKSWDWFYYKWGKMAKRNTYNKIELISKQ